MKVECYFIIIIMLHTLDERWHDRCSLSSEFSFEEIPLQIPDEITRTLSGMTLAVVKIVKVQKIHHQKVMLHAWEESCHCQCYQPPEFSFEEIPL